MEYFEDLQDFQNKLAFEVRQLSYLSLHADVVAKNDRLVIKLKCKKTGFNEMTLKLLFGENSNFYLLSSLAEELESLKVKNQIAHDQALKKENEIREREDVLAKKKIIAMKEAQVQNQKLAEAAKFRNEQALKEILVSLNRIEIYEKSHALLSGQRNLSTWVNGSEGDEDYTELELTRISNPTSVKDSYHVLLTNKWFNYGEVAMYDGSWCENELVSETYNSISFALKRCKDLIVEYQLLH